MVVLNHPSPSNETKIRQLEEGTDAYVFLSGPTPKQFYGAEVKGINEILENLHEGRDHGAWRKTSTLR